MKLYKLLVLLFIVVLVLLLNNIYSSFGNTTLEYNNAICLITFKPREIYCDFLNSFINYKIFVMVDDNEFDLTQFRINYKNITFIQIDNKECEKNGYINVNYMIKNLSSWDKALYYFGVINKKFDKVWFIEDDVFFYNEELIIKIDAKYKDDDLLSRYPDAVNNGDRKDWHWGSVTDIKFDHPHYGGMMCCVRMSRNMLESIHNYAKKHKTLFFLEILFPTIAKKNNLKYSNPDEFYTIFWPGGPLKDEDINANGLFHPIKDLDKHESFRKKIINSFFK